MFWLSFAAAFVVTIMIAAMPARVVAQVTSATETVTTSEIIHHVGVIAYDSMRDRDTPSRGLDLTAQYIADRFQRAGLVPSGDNGTWFQRYPILASDKSSSVMFVLEGVKTDAHKTRAVGASFAVAAHRIGSAVPEDAEETPVILVSGRHTVQSLRTAAIHSQVRDKVVVYVAPTEADSATRWGVIDYFLTTNTSRGVVVLSEEDSVTFDRRRQTLFEQSFPRPTLGRRRSWAVQVRPEAVPKLPSLLVGAGLDLARARVDSAPNVRELQGLKAGLRFSEMLSASDGPTAPNVMGLLEGSDPKLKYEYILILANMDHVTLGQGPADSTTNGARDNVLGASGLIALAQAFSQSGTRPRRSLLFLAVSGRAKGFWGSDHAARLVEKWRDRIATAANFPFLGPIDHAKTKLVIAALDLDMTGRLAKDSVWVRGIDALDVPTSPKWIAAAHPELQLTVVNGEALSTPRSDHFAFIRQGIPTLSFYAGAPAGDRRTAGSLAAIGPDEAARILRFAFYVGQEIANAPRPLRLNAEGRRQFLESRLPWDLVDDSMRTHGAR